MASDAATAIAYVGAFVGLVGGGVGLYNSLKAVQWKRAELANAYLRDFNSNPELVFAGRCLDWYGGPLIVPDSLRAYLPEDGKIIEHDRNVFKVALRGDITIGEMYDDHRLQLYRVAVDSFLSWLALVCSALDRNLFKVIDIEDVGYWIAKVESETVMHGFIKAFGYESSINRLVARFRSEENRYKTWHFTKV